SPYFSLISSIPAASASDPASTRAGSPGIILTPTNTITLITSNVTTEIIARRARNSIIAMRGLRNRHFVPGARACRGGGRGRAALVGIDDLARLVQQRVDLFVAGQGGVEAAPARLALVDVAVGIHAAAPADQERLQLAVVVVLQRRGELLGPQVDREAGLAGH